jgi:hypothetical protein
VAAAIRAVVAAAAVVTVMAFGGGCLVAACWEACGVRRPTTAAAMAAALAAFGRAPVLATRNGGVEAARLAPGALVAAASVAVASVARELPAALEALAAVDFFFFLWRVGYRTSTFFGGKKFRYDLGLR